MKKILYGAFVLSLLAVLNAPFTAVQAQNTVFTYQGQVLDNGSAFTGTGQFEFALVTSSKHQSHGDCNREYFAAVRHQLQCDFRR